MQTIQDVLGHHADSFAIWYLCIARAKPVRVASAMLMSKFPPAPPSHVTRDSRKLVQGMSSTWSTVRRLRDIDDAYCMFDVGIFETPVTCLGGRRADWFKLIDRHILPRETRVSVQPCKMSMFVSLLTLWNNDEVRS